MYTENSKAELKHFKKKYNQYSKRGEKMKLYKMFIKSREGRKRMGEGAGRTSATNRKQFQHSTY